MLHTSTVNKQAQFISRSESDGLTPRAPYPSELAQFECQAPGKSPWPALAALARSRDLRHRDAIPHALPSLCKVVLRAAALQYAQCVFGMLFSRDRFLDDKAISHQLFGETLEVQITDLPGSLYDLLDQRSCPGHLTPRDMALGEP